MCRALASSSKKLEMGDSISYFKTWVLYSSRHMFRRFFFYKLGKLSVFIAELDTFILKRHIKLKEFFVKVWNIHKWISLMVSKKINIMSVLNRKKTIFIPIIKLELSLHLVRDGYITNKMKDDKYVY